MPITFESSADDVAELVRQLGLERSTSSVSCNGASVGLQVAIRHPGLVRKLVFLGHERGPTPGYDANCPGDA